MFARGALRNLIRPLSSARLSLPYFPTSPVSSRPVLGFRSLAAPFQSELIPRWIPDSTQQHIHSLTDNRFPKRRPSTKSRRKRASLRPPGPYAWVQYVPGEPIPRSRPNEGSVQGRNRKMRIKLQKAFILAEKKKRVAQMQAASRKKRMESIERKMAAVARERAWAERLAELQRLEKEKNNTV
ncbi:hypothetical protein H6P81_003806 [Aristolochia fimbriata]|uniref:Uncharacterized protein n=1 Tax=Aristolochia fimbriata TaxID=158543 RepID=A0AAV7FEG4_ARIFI|nr:hypothetical protein H6P81_003806 [Aristolochia fimbriata]